MVFSPTRSAVEAVGQTFTLRRSEPENMPPMISRLGRRDIVLLGIGHTNAHVLRMWRMQPIPDAQLTCVSNFPTATLDLPVASSQANADLEFEAFSERIPPLGTKIRLVFQPKLAEPEKDKEKK